MTFSSFRMCHYESLVLFVDTEFFTAPVSVGGKKKKNQWTFGCAPIEMLPNHLALIQEISRFFPHICEAAFCRFAQEKHARSLEGTLVYSVFSGLYSCISEC